MALSEEKKPFKTKIPEKIMGEVSSFPSMPKAGIKLRALLAKKDVSVDEIEGILRHDPGLATNVLRLANSAFFGLMSLQISHGIYTLFSANFFVGLRA